MHSVQTSPPKAVDSICPLALQCKPLAMTAARRAKTKSHSDKERLL